MSIDFGASESYTDENGINWIGDYTLMQNTTSSTTGYQKVRHEPIISYREFSTDQRKNCYSVKLQN